MDTEEGGTLDRKRSGRQKGNKRNEVSNYLDDI